MSVRRDIARNLADGLHRQRYHVIAEPRHIDDTSVKRIVQVIRDSVTPGPEQGGFEEKLVLWVMSPKKDQPAAEDDLEAALDDTIRIVNTWPWAKFEKATRAVHESGLQAYTIDLTTHTS